MEEGKEGVYFDGSIVSDFLETTKPRILLLVLFATFVSFYLGCREMDFSLLGITLAGTGLLCASCNSLNQYLEREVDGHMPRTKTRPLPAGRLKPIQVLFFGGFLGISGTLLLAYGVNLLSAAAGLVALGIYLLVYTPLKRKTPWCTVIGALPGATPALMGWTAASGNLQVGGWALFAILFCWQIPHFMAIGTIYRHEYAAAGFPMLPVLSPASSDRHSIAFGAALIPGSLLPSLLGLTGVFFLWSALGLSAVFLGLCLGQAAGKRGCTAKTIFAFSILYLPVLYSLMILDKI